MATQTPAGDDGTLNGTTPVTIVPAPGASDQHVVFAITIHNVDTAVVTVSVRKVSAGGTRIIARKDLDPEDTLIIDERIVLDATTDSITAVMSGAAATTDPDWTSSWLFNDV